MENRIWAVRAFINEEFDEGFWNELIEKAASERMNAILFCPNNFICYKSHPEIADPTAFPREWFTEQVRKCRDRGIELLPEINFSATHDDWMGEYSRMVSTPTYYKVTKDLIEELYEVFESPTYIHLGMDEEGHKVQADRDYVCYRQGDLYMHDLRYFVNCVRALGATPWVWACPLFDMTEDFIKEFKPDEIVISPWYYNAFRREHWTPVESRAEYVAYYNEGDYAKMNIRFVEEDPFLVNFRAKALPLMEKGYRYIPCASVYNRCDYNTVELMEYFREGGVDRQILGYVTSPWIPLNRSETCTLFYEETFRFFREARKQIYGE